MDYIRRTYSVPAKRGARIEFRDHKGRWHKGVIVASRGMYLRARMPTLGARYVVTLHQTSDVRYLPNTEVSIER